MAITISSTSAATASTIQGVKLANQSTETLGNALSGLLQTAEQVADEGAAKAQAGSSTNPALGNNVDVSV